MARDTNSHPPARGVMVDELVARHQARLQNPDYEEWVIEGLLRPTTLGVLIGWPKAGKTSLARCLSMAVAGDKMTWLGRAIARGPVIFIELDEPEITVANHYAQILVRGAELHHYQDYGASMLPVSADKRFCWLAAWAREIGAVLIVIDTAFRFLAVRRPIAIADYGAMHPMMSRFQRLVADSRAAVLLLHHAPKIHGPLSPLGSQAIGGAVDSVLTVTRDAGGRRYLEADGRDVSMPSTRLEFSEGRISLGQSQLAEPAHDTCAVARRHQGTSWRTDAHRCNRERGSAQTNTAAVTRADGAGGRHPLEAARGSPWTDPVASARYRFRVPALRAEPFSLRHSPLFGPLLPGSAEFLRRSGEGRSSASGTRRHGSGTVVPPDHRTRETRPRPTSPAPGTNRVSPATTALRCSNHRPQCASIPPSCACLRSGLSPGAFRSPTASRRRHGPIVAIGTRASRRWRIQDRVRRLRLRIPRTGPTGVFTDSAQSDLPCGQCDIADLPSSASGRLRSQGVPEAYSVGPAANIPIASFRLSVPTSLKRPRWQSIAPPVAQIA